MKRIFILLISFAIGFGIIFTQSITVTSPNGGENWKIGEEFKIHWKSSGISGPVGIKLFKNNASLGYIAQNVPNTGIFKWKISNVIGVGPIKSGTDYKIQIKKSGVAGDVSDGNFTIKKAGNPSNLKQIDPKVFNNNTVMDRMPRINKDLFLIKPVIGVYEPKKGVVLLQSQAGDIKWKFTGVMLRTVRIFVIFQKTGALYTIAYNTPNDGFFKWELKKATWDPGEYRIRVQTTNGGVKGDSEIFTIAKPVTANPGLAKLRIDFLNLLNSYRKSKGKNPLVLDTCLNNAAQGHSEWMNATGKFSHTGKNGSSPWGRCSNSGCSCDSENIYAGSSAASSCFNSWKSSTGHNNNMLGSHTKMGIGISGGYWTAVFK